MSASLDWLEDGTPYSRQFNDRYHSGHEGGMAQSTGSFLHGCSLPEQWQRQPQWRILETGFGLGLNFLSTWLAWRQDAQRCQQLHFISTEAWPVSASDILQAAASRYPALLELARQLAAQYLDMHSGIHRLVFEQGRVHLTLAIGDARKMLREQRWTADSVYLDGFSPAVNPGLWDIPAIKAVASCCVAGRTRLATWCVARSVRDTLAQCGFQVERVAGTPPKKHNLRALYAPAWPTRARAALLPWPWSAPPPAGRQCVVIGAGLAGASMAWNMAERGWHVTVLDQAEQPASGASALPLGLFAPHISPDDAPLSRLTRAGVRSTRRIASQLLRQGQDWDASGVLEHRVGKKAGLPPADEGAEGIASTASHAATPVQRQQARLPPENSRVPAHPAVWHGMAGWLRPAALVKALLQHPNITWRGHSPVRSLQKNTTAPDGAQTLWQALDADGTAIASAPCLIVAVAFDSQQLIAPWLELPLALHAVRGQVAWGTLDVRAAAAAQNTLPPFPVNGKGSFIHQPSSEPPGGHFWISGGTFEHDCANSPPSTQEQQQALRENRDRLGLLMPERRDTLDALLFEAAPHGNVQSWHATRCTAPDRTPLFGPVSARQENSGLLLAAGLGSRGLTLAFLAAEILTAALHGEPLPVEQQLAQLVLTTRHLPR